MDLLIPFANTGEVENFDEGASPTGDMSLEKGFTAFFELKPEEGGLFILRKKFNKLLNLLSAENVQFKTQTFPAWIADAGSGTPYAYPKDAIVRYSDGNTYASKVANNTALPTDAINWVNFEVFGISGISNLSDKPTPVDTDNFALQEVGGDLKKLSFENLKLSLFNPTLTANATLTAIDNKIVMNGIVTSLGLEVGDVIQFTSVANANNQKLRTVESIINDNEIIVNYEHCGNRGNGTLKLTDETLTNATIKRIAKWYNAPDGLGQAWVGVTRTKGVTYNHPYAQKRCIMLAYQGFGNLDYRVFTITTNGLDLIQRASNTGGAVYGSWVGSINDSYKVYYTYDISVTFSEMR